jgi:hypothetical protein
MLDRDHPRYRLPEHLADMAHAKAWSESVIKTFARRAVVLKERGFSAQDAFDLAERLHLRDVTDDERRCCIECQHFHRWRCDQYRSALLDGPVISCDLALMLQRCPAFECVEVAHV